MSTPTERRCGHSAGAAWGMVGKVGEPPWPPGQTVVSYPDTTKAAPHPMGATPPVLP